MIRLAPAPRSASPRAVPASSCRFPAPPQAALPRPAAGARRAGIALTLITGDVVRVLTRADGKRSVSLEAGADGAVPDAAISEVGDHLYVVPRSAAPLLAANRVDRDLFDVAELIRSRLRRCTRRQTLPVIVDYGRGRRLLRTSRGKPALATRGEDGGAARRSARPRSLLTRNARGPSGARSTEWSRRRRRCHRRSPTARRLDLDGRVQATLDVSVPQIGAPEAWAAGYDGTGQRRRARHRLRPDPPRPRRARRARRSFAPGGGRRRQRPRHPRRLDDRRQRRRLRRHGEGRRARCRPAHRQGPR